MPAEGMTPNHIINWLKSRGLSDRAIATLKWNGSRIGIPVIKDDGSIFHKWRKDPTSTDDTPKYVADQGGRRSLYGTLEGEIVVVCEGELDALLLIDRGLSAVSSTTGASNWSPSWSPRFLGKKVLVWYDADEAGRLGAEKVATQVSRYAKQVRIAVCDGSFGKDVTEQLATTGMHDPMNLLKSGRYTFRSATPYVPPPPPDPRKHEEDTDSVIDVLERAVGQLRRNGNEYSCKCPFHSENNASLSANRDKNVWYCHGCGAGGGVKKLKEMLGCA
ncbi:MAG: CHC2 zinc finger domain-containing protein [Sphaerochaeta sp.]|jgi:hypothetical protein|nr:CHC2 zinc finger domain-containing protein [Sphaerochaeta sp.]